MFVAREEKIPLGGLFGLIIPSAFIGAASLAGGYSFLARVIEDPDQTFATVTFLMLLAQSLALFSVTLILTGRQSRWLLAILLSVLVALISIMPTLVVSWLGMDGKLGWDQAAIVFADPGLITAYFAALVLAKTVIDQPPDTGLLDYRGIFLNAITLPVLLVIVVLAGGLLSILLSSLYSMMGLFQEGWSERLPSLTETVLLAIAGGVAGAFIAAMRMQRVVIGVVRYGLLLVMRFALPVVAVISAVAIILMISENNGQNFREWIAPIDPLFWSTFLLFAFALVYQNGQGAKPALWLRASAWAVLLGLPFFLIPPLLRSLEDVKNIADMSAWLYPYGLLFLVTLSVLAGLVSEIYWRAEKWMPPVRYGFRAVWIIAALMPIFVAGTILLGGSG
jgi:hypothetical protein